ncbi:uncharacterized protein LOC103676991 isoform X1 [Ursus maritimus]|uniref:Uncharacterized protein LOC103676991 isoform X1 n=2 Tax=Ursus maritimus TaxID=29073 RepID=A0A8M1FML5_URSMA|nr:uncharacterized protein LOC103676991 isoform X1 [Ursus maritimus]
MTRPVGTATWVGAAEGGRRSADVMDGLGGACGRGPPVFGVVLAARRDWLELRCSPSRPPFHIQQRRRGQPRRRLFTRLRPGRARVHVRTCPHRVTSFPFPLPFSLPRQNPGLRAFQRNVRLRKNARGSHRVRCGDPALFINWLCVVLLPKGIKAKRRWGRTIKQNNFIQKSGGEDRGAVVKSKKKKGSNKSSWVGHHIGTEGFLSDLVTNIGCDLGQIIWFLRTSVSSSVEREFYLKPEGFLPNEKT